MDWNFQVAYLLFSHVSLKPELPNCRKSSSVVFFKKRLSPGQIRPAILPKTNTIAGVFLCIFSEQLFYRLPVNDCFCVVYCLLDVWKAITLLSKTGNLFSFSLGIIYFTITLSNNSRSCHLEVFCKDETLKTFAKFTGKHLC